MKKYLIILFYFMLNFNAFAKELNFKTYFPDVKNITKKELKNNFSKFRYDGFNENNKIAFDMLIPNGWIPNVERTKNPLNNNNSLTMLALITNPDDKNTYGYVAVFASDRELDTKRVSNYILKKQFNAFVVEEKNEIMPNGVRSDFFAINKDNVFFRGVNRKDGKLYYICLYFSEDKESYLKYKNDFAVSVNSFNLTNGIGNIAAVDLVKKDFKKPFKYSIMYPKGWSIKKDNTNDILSMRILNDKDMGYYILVADNKVLNQEKLSRIYLNNIKDMGIKLEDTNKSNFSISSFNGNVIGNIKAEYNSQEVELYLKAFEYKNKTILASTISVPKESNYITYYENKRMVDLIMNGIEIY